MSKFYDQADAIAESLQTLEILADSRVVVDRQHDIVSELKKVIGRQVGNLILVTWTGGNNADESSDGPRIESGFTVTLFSKPIIRKGETAADDLVEAMAEHLHDWRPSATASYQDRLIVSGVNPIPAPELLAYQITLKTPTQL